MANPNDPHGGSAVLAAGAELGAAKAAVVLIHGRGADAADILSLSTAFDRSDVAFLAPEAAGNTWYPFPFLAPVEQNEPYLSSALGVLAALVTRIGAAGLPPEKVMILGFSQGACLALEFAARTARRYGGVVAFSGGLIGRELKRETYGSSLDGTPVFLGCSDVDPHIPLARVKASSEMLRRLDAVVSERIYPGMGHTINVDEMGHAARMLAAIAGER
jgi:predicted esterase